MTLPLLTNAQVRFVRREQRAVWEASRAIASPSVDLVLDRPGVGALPPQTVIVQWNKRTGRGQVAARGDGTPWIDLTFRRLEEDGFDAQPGDRFELDGQRGAIERVYADKGIIRAEARLVTGALWP